MSSAPARLRAKILPLRAVTTPLRDEMWDLFSRYYVDSPRAVFDQDLAEKRHVIVLRDDAGAVAGFSTLQCFSERVEGRRIAVVFSGDTIVDEKHWGQTALQKAFLRYIVRAKLEHPLVPVYWFLITKGYKTYLLLTRNFPVHWPRHACATPPFEQAVLDSLARAKFGSRWDSARGVLHHVEASGRLRSDVAPLDDAIADRHPDVRFFAETNPGHAAGDELCCLGLVNPAMWLFYLKKLARRRLLGRRT